MSDPIDFDASLCDDRNLTLAPFVEATVRKSSARKVTPAEILAIFALQKFKRMWKIRKWLPTR